MTHDPVVPTVPEPAEPDSIPLAATYTIEAAASVLLVLASRSLIAPPTAARALRALTQVVRELHPEPPPPDPELEEFLLEVTRDATLH